MLAWYLAGKEMLRNKVRFVALIMIVALIMMLVLFLAAMGDGLALSAKQYIEQINADLLVFHADIELSIPASRLDHAKLRQLARLDGVAAVGPIGFSTATILLPCRDGSDRLDVALVGVEPGQPGSPSVKAGTPLLHRHAKEVVVDQHVLNQADVRLGSIITVKVVQGTEEQRYDLTVVGFTSGQKYNFAPSIFVPLDVWDGIRPQGQFNAGQEVLFNIVAVKLRDPQSLPLMAAAIERRVAKVAAVDKMTAYQAMQGYQAMQSTTSAQQNAMLFIVVLIVGGFFQIQTIQKTAQIGMLRAIGATNGLVVATLMAQMVLTTVLGLVVGGGIVWGFTLFIPPTVPLVFEGSKILIALATLLAVGPVAGLVAIRTALKIEPLTALGLGS